ncbi:hypothetical protein CO700_16045 [Citrobacter koseri]|uniref:Uncharacterized protein n=1 Tax=Citrobacter koseri (strain ATCC BAA-895 / CDC 4225-83 / SGSC4696) TaxID=290338 RepID=A8ADD1_CITK8|nr:hypothetical protein CKO_00331 [Citrobacter koseri ATCC BAA-895]ATF98446.1 hypothetical protein CO700_16045 [Citrobacter koseri]KXA05116.1 hypothetical protein HMPREF3207_00952 [Citrobacter koseri]KXB46274.1 hypothetical protein HMPREF0208_00781 [Citrobacter koseri]
MARVTSGAPHIITSLRGINFEGSHTLTTQRKNLLSIYSIHVTRLNPHYHACLLCFFVVYCMNFSEV